MVVALLLVLALLSLRPAVTPALGVPSPCVEAVPWVPREGVRERERIGGVGGETERRPTAPPRRRIQEEKEEEKYENEYPNGDAELERRVLA